MQTPARRTKGCVHLVGAGPGAADLLTLRALRLLQGADAVVYDRLVSPEILALAPKAARMVAVGKAPGAHSVPQERINEILHDLARDGLEVVRLKGGDPLIFGRGSEEAAYLRARAIAHDFCPGITAAQGAAASTGIGLTHRGLASTVRYVTGHRAKDRPLDLDWKSLASADTTLVIYMGRANIAEISLRLIHEGLSADLPVLAIAGATTPGETRLLSNLGQIVSALKSFAPEGPVLFIIGRVVALCKDAPLADLAPEIETDLAPDPGAVAHA